jgi:thioredoxin 1
MDKNLRHRRNFAVRRILLFLMMSILSGILVIGSSQPKESLVKRVKEKPAVTFIELGSVRCIPCQKMQLVMDTIEKQYQGRVRVVFYDVWTTGGKPYANKYRIKLIPTQVFLNSKGKEYFRHEGFLPLEEVRKVLEKQGVK